jgi:hypothetical protein
MSPPAVAASGFLPWFRRTKEPKKCSQG